jgi:peptidoglycan hydrolase-like protein with peptidoglycan-binding domain
MITLGQIRLIAVLATIFAFSPANVRAQSAVAPSTTVRVIEILDPSTGQRVREVSQDLTAGEISRIQRALASAGFDPGRATGALNGTTLVALDRFQSSRSLVRCGCVSYETILALGIHPTVVATIRAPLSRGYGSRVLVLAPHGRRNVGVGHQPAVIVGHGVSVFVGHDPARGAGELARRPHFPDRRSHVRDPRPPRPRPGSTIAGPGAELRRIAPRPQPAGPRPPRTP